MHLSNPGQDPGCSSQMHQLLSVRALHDLHMTLLIEVKTATNCVRKVLKADVLRHSSFSVIEAVSRIDL